jgi:putative peptidoglycan lipid II flippase
MFKRKFGSLGHSHLTMATLKFVIAAVVAGGIGFTILQALGGAKPGAFPVLSVLAAATTCALIGSVMTAVYLVVLKLLKSEEIETLIRPIRAFLKR